MSFEFHGLEWRPGRREAQDGAVQRALDDGSPGRALEAPLRTGPELDISKVIDISNVRVHTDESAAALAAGVGADAFTRGTDIYFGAGMYQPDSRAGQELLRHELTHVVQQASGEISGFAGQVVPAEHPSEARAWSPSALARRTQLPGARPSSMQRPAIQRQPSGPGRTAATAPPVPSSAAKGGVRIDEGGAATVKDLVRDMNDDVLKDWQTAALEGVTRFVSHSLSSRIDDIESGSWETFILGLLGNTVWAATTFIPGGWVVFALSMTGIGLAASPTIPKKSKSAIPEVTDLAIKYINASYAGMKKQTPKAAVALLEQHPGATQYRAMAEMIRTGFAQGMYDIDPTYATVPTINQDAVGDALLNFATERLDIVEHVGEEHEHSHKFYDDEWTEGNLVELAWVLGLPGHPPRLVTLNTHIINGLSYPRFRSWVSPDNKDAAIKQWYSKRSMPPATYNWYEVGTLAEMMPALTGSP